MQLLLENAISPWGQFCCHREIRHKFLNVGLVTVLASEWAIKIGMFILLIKYIYTGWSGVMNWGSRLYRCFLFMVVSYNPTWNKDKFVLLPWISNRGILHPKQLSSDKSYKTSKTLLTTYLECDWDDNAGRRPEGLLSKAAYWLARGWTWLFIWNQDKFIKTLDVTWKSMLILPCQENHSKIPIRRRMSSFSYMK